MNIVPEIVAGLRDAVTEASAAVEIAGKKVAETIDQQRAAVDELAERKSAASVANFEAVEQGMKSPEPAREETKRLASLERTLAAFPEVLRKRKADHSTAQSDLAAAQADFMGTIWRMATDDWQPAARQAVENWIAEGHAPLAQLAAVERVREQFSSGNLHLPEVGTARPWNGRALVNTMLKGLPTKLRGDALNADEIAKSAITISDEFIALIQGDRK